MMGGMMGGFGSGFGGFGLIGMLLNLVLTIGLIIGVVVLVVWLWRRISPTSHSTQVPLQPASLGNAAREVLQTRYARGDITREQYQQMLVDLA